MKHIHEGYGYPVEVSNVKYNTYGEPIVDYVQLARKEYLRLINEKELSSIQKEFIKYYETITTGKHITR